MTDIDQRFMHHALMLARRGLGRVAPNPAVGCVLVKDDVIVGRGWTQPSGRPHAETVALKAAGTAARGATAYVTLEPCAHHGETGPCAEALVKAGVARVVIAAADPDPRVEGRGAQILRGANIEVTEAVRAAEALSLNRGFFYRITKARPMFTLKVASRPDGSMETREGAERWITGTEARDVGHMMRATHDAILIGINTALTDDPSLDCRLAGLEGRSPIRIVLDRQGQLPTSSKLAVTARDIPTWCITSAENDNLLELTKQGVRVLTVTDCHNMIEVAALLAQKGLTRVLVEGGATVHSAFMEADMADDLAWFRADGSDHDDLSGVIAVFDQMGLAPRAVFAHTVGQDVGKDRLERFTRDES